MSRSSLHTSENKTLVAFLVKARKAGQLTQAQLAERLGKTQQYVSRYEKGDRRVDLLEFIVIARGLGVAPDRLLAQLLRKLPKSFEA